MTAVLAFDGCYEAQRAAALSGVPKSTVYDWARKQIVVPSISAEREMLWSYADLMTLRIVSWLRHPKGPSSDARPAAAMREVRDALERLDEMDLDPWEGHVGRSPLVVDRGGHIMILTGDVTVDLAGQLRLGQVLDLLGPFDDPGGGRGPDLRRPRSHLRIVPGKCAGEPHVEGSRVTTLAIAALARRGFDLDDVARLYPDESLESLAEAIDLERALGTLAIAA